MTHTLTQAAAGKVPAPTRAIPYDQLLERLSVASVSKAHDPYNSIAWDGPDALDPRDPRLCLSSNHPLAQTAWYQGLDVHSRRTFSVRWMAQTLKNGIELEGILSRGLLRYACHIPNGDLEYRYVMHEVIEEGRHSQMFQELINRLQLKPEALSPLKRKVGNWIVRAAEVFPHLFFSAVWGGEAFIDHENRELLRQPRAETHPIVRRVMQIHVTEEARHMRFAEGWLREHLHELRDSRRELLAYFIPISLRDAVTSMLVPDGRLMREFGLSRRVLGEAFGPGTAHHANVVRIASPMRQLCSAHGMYSPRHAAWWKRQGVA